MGQQGGDQFLLPGTAGLGLEHQAHRRVLGRLVAHQVEHRQHTGLELRLLLRQRLFPQPHFRVGDFLNLFQHFLGTDIGWQLGHHQLPLATRQVFDFPARAHFQRTTAATHCICDVRAAADDLPAAGVVRAGNQHPQFVVAQGRRLDQRNTGSRNLAQVVARNFSGQAHRNAAGTVEQHKRQARWQLNRLFGGAIVVGHKGHGAFVDFVQQQAGDARQPGLGITHGCGTVTIAAAEIALPVYQRVTLRKVLCHTHQRVIRGLVAVRMETTQHVTDHPCRLDWPGTNIAVGTAKPQPHARHRIQDATLHRFLPVAHVGQGAPFNDAQRVFEVGALGITGQVGGVITVARWPL